MKTDEIESRIKEEFKKHAKSDLDWAKIAAAKIYAVLGSKSSEPDPELIDSMAMRYRHDFGLLEERQKESIRTTMRQLWEEVVGRGFYQATPVPPPQMELETRTFQYASDLTNWVNLHDVEVVSITRLGEFEGEGYRLFYRGAC
jgi:hypothetical protein